jgi:outer membrane protein assembly factor BamB
MAAFLALLATPGAAMAQDPWPMVGGDPGHTGVAPGPEPPYRVAWSVDLRDEDDVPVAPPVAGEGLVAVVTRDRVVALDPGDGEVLWEVPRERGTVGPAALSEDLVLFGSGRGEEAELVAVNREDGEEAWRLTVGGVIPGGVTVSDGSGFVGTRAGEVVAVDLEDGEEGWRFEAAGVVEGAPAVLGDLVLATGQDLDPGARRAALHAIDRIEGEQAWSVEVTDVVGASSAVSTGDGRVVVGGGDLRVRAIDPEDGRIRWEAVTRAPFPARAVLAVPDDIVAVDTLGHLHLLERATGEERWRFRVPGFVLTGSPAAVGGFVVMADDSGQLSAIDLVSGLLAWRYQVGEDRLLGAAPAGGVIVTASEGGRVLAFEPDPGGTLLEEPSPTTLFVDRALLNFAGAFAVTMVVLVGLFQLLRRWRNHGEEGQA